MCSYQTCLTNSILLHDIENVTTQTVTTGDHYIRRRASTGANCLGFSIGRDTTDFNKTSNRYMPYKVSNQF